MKNIIISLLFLIPLIPVQAQDAKKALVPDTAYLRTIRQRATKIVTALDITDTAKFRRVRDIVAAQYSDLNDIHTDRNSKTKSAKQTLKNKDSLALAVKAYENEADAKMYNLHFAFISKLLVDLTPDQVAQVKDGLTYSVLPITFKGYQSMLPQLTEPQKAQIYAWLVEAREHAIDAESSEKKHGWFGKYKGRINNYLSTQGYDMKKASDEWAKRLKEEGINL
jgi:hypothetical protein